MITLPKWLDWVITTYIVIVALFLLPLALLIPEILQLRWYASIVIIAPILLIIYMIAYWDVFLKGMRHYRPWNFSSLCVLLLAFLVYTVTKNAVMAMGTGEIVSYAALAGGVGAGAVGIAGMSAVGIMGTTSVGFTFAPALLALPVWGWIALAVILIAAAIFGLSSCSEEDGDDDGTDRAENLDRSTDLVDNTINANRVPPQVQTTQPLVAIREITYYPSFSDDEGSPSSSASSSLTTPTVSPNACADGNYINGSFKKRVLPDGYRVSGSMNVRLCENNNYFDAYFTAGSQQVGKKRLTPRYGSLYTDTINLKTTTDATAFCIILEHQSDPTCFTQ